MNNKKPPKEDNESFEAKDELSAKEKKASKKDGSDNSCGCKAAECEESDKRADMLESMIKENHSLAMELAGEREKHLRIAAEYDNFRKRSQKERETIYTEVRADTIIKLLPVFDNLERALNQETVDEAYRKGIEMTMSQLREILLSMGVVEIDASPGKKFNPDFHDAVMHVEDESLKENIVVEEFQRGFKLGDKVLRYSAVKVAN